MPPVSAGRNAAKSPRDLTGRIHRDQQAKRTRELAQEAIPLDQHIEAAYQRGLEVGDRIGVEAWTTALVKMYQAEGIEAVHEWLEELVAE